MAVEEEKEVEEEYGDTPAGRLTQSLLMQTASHRATTNRRRPDSREYRSVSLLLTFAFSANVMLFPRGFSAMAKRSEKNDLKYSDWVK